MRAGRTSTQSTDTQTSPAPTAMPAALRRRRSAPYVSFRIDPDDRAVVARRPDGTRPDGDREGRAADVVRVLDRFLLGIDLPDLVALVVGEPDLPSPIAMSYNPNESGTDPSHRRSREARELAERGDNPDRAESVGERAPDRASRWRASSSRDRCARSHGSSPPRSASRRRRESRRPGPLKADDAPAFGSVQLPSESSDGSMRKMRPSVVPTQSAPAAATRSAGVPGTENVLTTRVFASIREIVPAPSFELITQTQSSEAVTSVGAVPTGIAATTLRETGSMAATEFGGRRSRPRARAPQAVPPRLRQRSAPRRTRADDRPAGVDA